MEIIVFPKCIMQTLVITLSQEVRMSRSDVGLQTQTHTHTQTLTPQDPLSGSLKGHINES